MSYSTEIYARLKTEFSNIGLDIEKEKAFYKAFSDGCEMVLEPIERIIPNYFLDIENSIGYYMYCSLFNLKTIDKSKLGDLMSAKPEEHKPRLYKASFFDYVKDGAIGLDRYIVFVSLKDNITADNLKNMARFLYDRLSPGVIGEYIGEYLNFDKFDSLSMNADEWEQVASASFTFIDSLGGIFIE